MHLKAALSVAYNPQIWHIFHSTAYQNHNTGYFDWLRKGKASLSCSVKHGTLTSSHPTLHSLTHIRKLSHDPTSVTCNSIWCCRVFELARPEVVDVQREIRIITAKVQKQSRSRVSSVRISRMAMNERRFSTEKVVDLCSCRVRWLLRRVPFTAQI